MDSFYGLSSDRNSNSKRCLEVSGEVATDSLAYEAELRSKLEAEQAARECVAKERAAWGTPSAWFQEDE